MKIFIIGPDFINFVYSLERVFRRQGHEVRNASYRHPASRPWLERKLAKIGIGTSQLDYLQRYQREFSLRTLAEVEEFRPDILVIENGDFLDADCLHKLKSCSGKVLLYTLDAIYRFKGIEKILAIADGAICMDYNDVEMLRRNYPALPVSAHQFGYDPEIFYPDDTIPKDIDISFIGAPSHNRKALLCEAAKYAKANGLKFVVHGAGYWDERYFWKKWSFRKKWQPLQEYCSNRNVTAEQAADIYRRSKVCLNIHIKDHDIINNRCFEIPACGSVMLCDRKIDFDELNSIPVAEAYDACPFVRNTASVLTGCEIFYTSDNIKLPACFWVEDLAKHILEKI